MTLAAGGLPGTPVWMIVVAFAVAIALFVHLTLRDRRRR